MHHRLLSHPSKRDSFNEPLAHAMKAFRDEPLARIFFWQIANFILFPLNPQTHSTLTRFMDPPRVSSNIQYSSKSILCRQECRNCFKVQSRASHKNWNSLVQTIFIARISEALNKSKINSLNILQTFVIFLSDDQKKILNSKHQRKSLNLFYVWWWTWLGWWHVAYQVRWHHINFWPDQRSSIYQ